MLDDDSADYKALFVKIDYERLMQELTKGKGVWKRYRSTGNFTNFQMHSLKPVSKAW